MRGRDIQRDASLLPVKLDRIIDGPIQPSRMIPPPSGNVSRYPSRSVSVLCLTDTLGAVDRRHESIEGNLGDMTSRTGRIALITVGVIALIFGGVFAGQGMNLIPGSFMTGSRMWLSIGLIIAIVGIILIVLGLRRPGHGRTSR